MPYRVRLHMILGKGERMEDGRNGARHARGRGLSAGFVAGWLAIILMAAVVSMGLYLWSMPPVVPVDGVSVLMG